jgi:hypothetical protein
MGDGLELGTYIRNRLDVFVLEWDLIATGSAKLYLLDWVRMGWNGFSQYSSDGLRGVRHTFLKQTCDWLERFGVPAWLYSKRVGWNMIGVNVKFSVLNGHFKQVLVPFISNEQFMLNKYTQSTEILNLQRKLMGFI